MGWEKAFEKRPHTNRTFCAESNVTIEKKKKLFLGPAPETAIEMNENANTQLSRYHRLPWKLQYKTSSWL